jgi:hypothetical protein
MFNDKENENLLITEEPALIVEKQSKQNKPQELEELLIVEQLIKDKSKFQNEGLFDYTNLKEVGNSDTGGKTGSRAMLGSDGKKVQFKPSFTRKKAFFQKVIKGNNDSENLIEVFAANIRNAIVKQHNESVDAKRGSNANIIEEETKETRINKIQELLDIKIVKSRGAGLEIASKWVTEDGATIESKFAPKADTSKTGRIKLIGDHIEPTDGTNEVQMKTVFNTPQKKYDFAFGLALALAIDDHDVNLGNFTSEKDRIIKIDFGKAFGTLVRGPSIIGGGIKNTQNTLLDSLNREKVASGKLGGSANKISRFYPGYMPNREFAKALADVSSATIAAKEEINAELKKVQDNLAEYNKTQHEADKTNLENSVKALARKVGCQIQPGDNINSMVEKLSEKLNQRTVDRAQEMKTVAKMMHLQVDIDELLKLNDKVNPEKIKEIQGKYNKLLADSIDQTPGTGIFHKQTRGITWVKNGNHKAIEGGLQSYITQRAAELDKEHSHAKDKSQKKDTFKENAIKINKSVLRDPKKQSFFSRLFDKLLLSQATIPDIKKQIIENSSGKITKIKNNTITNSNHHVHHAEDIKNKEAGQNYRERT